MRVRLKEDPKEWSKSTLLTVLALTILSSVLCWRSVLSVQSWRAILFVLALTSLSSLFFPRWFRGYYRISTRFGFGLSLVLARLVLTGLFFTVVTPLALIFRWSGKDALHLKRASHVNTYWTASKPTSPLDRLF